MVGFSSFAVFLLGFLAGGSVGVVLGVMLFPAVSSSVARHEWTRASTGADEIWLADVATEANSDTTD